MVVASLNNRIFLDVPLLVLGERCWAFQLGILLAPEGVAELNIG